MPLGGAPTPPARAHPRRRPRARRIMPGRRPARGRRSQERSVRAASRRRAAGGGPTSRGARSRPTGRRRASGRATSPRRARSLGGRRPPRCLIRLARPPFPPRAPDGDRQVAGQFEVGKVRGLAGALFARAAARPYVWSMTDGLKRPRDTDQLAELIVDLATGEASEAAEEPAPLAAAERGRMGGRKGGARRAASPSPEERSEIAERAAKPRWGR